MYLEGINWVGIPNMNNAGSPCLTGRLKGNITVDPAEKYPSLIDCLDKGENGLMLDLDLPSGGGIGRLKTPFQVSLFSKTIRARIKTDGDDIIQDVHLIVQRDRYDRPDSLVPVNNMVVEAAWQRAFGFHKKHRLSKPPFFFKHQVDSDGRLQPFQPLFLCRETNQWFPPVCPQCGLVLTLCRDDALLEERGLPTYSGSLDRFLACASCTPLSAESPFYVRDKTDGMPAWVRSAGDLVADWKKLIDHLPAGATTDLPCRGCSHMDACYGREALAQRRLVPFSFYPFYLFTFPAPAMDLEAFLPILSGASRDKAPKRDTIGSLMPGDRFLFQDEDRHFLEILYLKLTLLDQVFRHFFSQENANTPQASALSIDGIGIDLYPVADGLPALWNFDVRILDAIGSFEGSPFTPVMPEAPRLHFLGAIWFRTLLVNSQQNATAVYARVGQLLDQLKGKNGPEVLEKAISDAAGVFAGNQIYWLPDHRRLPETWQVYWKQAIHLGFQLVHAGLKAGAGWDNGQFEAALDALRKQVKGEMFTARGMAASDAVNPSQSEKVSLLLHGILERWKAQAVAADHQPLPEAAPRDLAPDETLTASSSADEPSPSPDDRAMPGAGLQATTVPEAPIPQPLDTRWDEDRLEETLIFSASDAAPASDASQRDVPGPTAPATGWENDMEETVVLRSESTPPPTVNPNPEDDMDQTVVISPRSTSPDSPPSGRDNGPAGTQMPNTTAASPASSSGSDQPLEETVILSTGGPPDSNKASVSKDDDMDVTIIQGGDRQSATFPWPEADDPVGPDRLEDKNDPDATIIIPASNRQPASTDTNDDDDISEQTIIIRSGVKKE
jgi:hypothetical protein